MPKPTYMQYLLDRAYAQKRPVSGTIELTARCNLSCKMCYIHRKRWDPEALAGERPTAFWLDMIDQLRQAGTLTLLLTGGEPLLYPDFAVIYQACRQAGMFVSVNTNGALLTDAHVALFAQCPPVRLNVSLYGASPATYQALCGQGEMYTRVTENLRRLRLAGIPLRINFTVTEQNRQDIQAVHEFARELDVPIQSATYMFPPTRALGEKASCRMPPEQAAACAVACDQAKLSPAEFAGRARAFAAGQLPSAPPDPETLRAPGERIRCRAGTSSFWLTYDGRLLPCGMWQTPAVSLTDGLTFAQGWERLKQQTQQVCLPAACGSCGLRRFCEVCAAACWAENQRFDAVPEYLCQKTQATVAAMKALCREEP